MLIGDSKSVQSRLARMFSLQSSPVRQKRARHAVWSAWRTTERDTGGHETDPAPEKKTFNRSGPALRRIAETACGPRFRTSAEQTSVAGPTLQRGWSCGDPAHETRPASRSRAIYNAQARAIGTAANALAPRERPMRCATSGPSDARDMRRFVMLTVRTSLQALQ